MSGMCVPCCCVESGFDRAGGPCLASSASQVWFEKFRQHDCAREAVAEYRLRAAAPIRWRVASEVLLDFFRSGWREGVSGTAEVVREGK
jgi:hypothetical protein